MKKIFTTSSVYRGIIVPLFDIFEQRDTLKGLLFRTDLSEMTSEERKKFFEISIERALNLECTDIRLHCRLSKTLNIEPPYSIENDIVKIYESEEEFLNDKTRINEFTSTK